MLARTEDIAADVFAFLLCAAASGLVVLLRHTAPQPGAGIRLLVDMLWGSALVGVLYIIIAMIRPDPGPANLSWTLVIPFTVGVLQQRRWLGVLRGLPLTTGGLLSFIAFAMALRLPLD